MLPFSGQPYCIVVAGEVIAEGQDGTSQHPLSHALMVAIDAAAARDRRLWPNNSQTTSNASAALLAGVDPLLPVPVANSNAELETDLPGNLHRTFSLIKYFYSSGLTLNPDP